MFIYLLLLHISIYTGIVLDCAPPLVEIILLRWGMTLLSHRFWRMGLRSSQRVDFEVVVMGFDEASGSLVVEPCIASHGWNRSFASRSTHSYISRHAARDSASLSPMSSMARCRASEAPWSKLNARIRPRSSGLFSTVITAMSHKQSTVDCCRQQRRRLWSDKRPTPFPVARQLAGKKVDVE